MKEEIHLKNNTLEFITSQQLLNTRQVAQICNVSISKINKLRHFGGGPDFIKIGKLVRYTIEDVEEWLRQSKFSSTSEFSEFLEDCKGNA